MDSPVFAGTSETVPIGTPRDTDNASLMCLNRPYHLPLLHIPHPDLAILTATDQHRTGGMPTQTAYPVQVVAEAMQAGECGAVPKPDRLIQTPTGEQGAIWLPGNAGGVPLVIQLRCQEACSAEIPKAYGHILGSTREERLRGMQRNIRDRGGMAVQVMQGLVLLAVPQADRFVGAGTHQLCLVLRPAEGSNSAGMAF